MEWYIMNGTGLRATATELVVQKGEDEWELCSDVTEKLEELCEQLDNEDEKTVAIRRELALSDLIRSQLVVVVRMCSCQSLGVMQLALKVLSKLTNPMYLLSAPQSADVKEHDKRTLLEDLHRIVVDFHEVLTDESIMASTIRHMEMLIDDCEEGAVMDDDACTTINSGLLVFRNLLTVRAGSNQWTNEQAHNRIVSSLLNNSFGSLLVNLLRNSNMSNWYMSIAQLISLLFMSQNERDFALFVLREDRLKRAHTSTISENESGGTSPLSFTDCSNGSSSEGDPESTVCRRLTVTSVPGGLAGLQSLLTRPPMSKSSPPLKRRREVEEVLRTPKVLQLEERLGSLSTANSAHNSNMDAASCSTGTSLSSLPTCEDDASVRAVSTGDCSRSSSVVSKISAISSNEVDSGQAPSPPSQSSSENSENLRRKSGKVTVTLTRHVREQLMCFTHQLMGSTAISRLCHCLQDNMLIADKTLAHTIENYLLWLTGLFTKFGTLKDAGWKSVRHILSPQLFSYLTYRCTRLMMQVLQTEGNNQQLYLACIRRLYLACRALHCAIQVIEFFIYKKKHMEQQECVELTEVQSYILHCRDLRQFFLLAIRNFRPQSMSRLFLNEIIMCNHRYLLVVEELTSKPGYIGPLKMLDHVRQFATLSTMRQYALALDTFETNDRALNECIFTLMYHVAGDCQQPEVLFQLPLMCLFTKIIESSTSVSQDAMNMIEYVMDRFLDLAHLSPELCANFLYTANMAAAECSLMKEQDEKFDKDLHASMRESSILLANNSANEPGTSVRSLTSLQWKSRQPANGLIAPAKDGLVSVKREKIKAPCCPPLFKSDGLMKMESVTEEIEEDLVVVDSKEEEEDERKMREEWTVEETNNLLTIYLTRYSSKSTPSAPNAEFNDQWVTDILLELQDSGIDKSRQQIVFQLNRLGLVQDGSTSEKSVSQRSDKKQQRQQQRQQQNVMNITSLEELISGIRNSEGGVEAMTWLQHFFLEVAYCRLGGHKVWEQTKEQERLSPHTSSAPWAHEEPVVLHHMARSHDIPMIAASEYEERRLCNIPFRELLRRLGFLLPSQPDRFFPIFPRSKFDPPEELLANLRALGPLPEDAKFSHETLEVLSRQKLDISPALPTSSTSLDSEEKSSSLSSRPSVPQNMWVEIVSMQGQRQQSVME